MRKLYKKMPLFLQHILLTVKNNHSYYQKYRAIPIFNSLQKVIKNLDENQWINDGHVLERINALIATATANVPYYIENKAQYPKLESVADLKKLPILYKQTLKSRNKDFISRLSNSSNTYFFKTSGSTGTPLEGGISLTELHHRFLAFLSSLKMAKINYSHRVGRFLGAEVADGKNIYRKDFINNHFLFSIYHISESTIDKYYDALVQNKIEIIEGYPSTIYSLVKFFKIKGLQINNVKNVLTTAEKLLDYQKEEIESFFNCKIFDFYGSSEGSAYLFLHEGKYINANKVGIIEVVDENYNEVAPGILGRMLVTSFTSSFTPLIRYDIGDYAVVSKSKPANENEYLIDEIVGRSEDVFVTAEGIQFTRFSLCLKYLPEGVIESQLHLKQRSKKVKVFYTNSVGAIKDSNKFKPFEDKFESMLGRGYEFEYQYLEQFDKSARGKLRAVIIQDND